MKLSLISFCLLMTVSSVNAQRVEYTWDYITFEEPYRFLEIDSGISNIWKIGTPDKQLLNSSFAGLNSIFTGGDPGYPVNNHSTFTLKISSLNIDHYPYSVYLEFMHQLDTEEGKDGGFIEVSYDGGESWVNIIDDRSACMFPGDSYETHGLYTTEDTLYSGIPGFSGQVNFWSKVRFGWEYCLTKSEAGYRDSMLLRFNFISDEDDTSRDGWNIDHIRLFSMPITGDAADEYALDIRVVPNPAVDEIRVISTRDTDIDRLRLFDLSGKLLGVVEDANIISVSGQPAGMYLLEIKSGTLQTIRKISKQ